MFEFAFIVVRTLFMYVFLLIIFRLMGKREIAELSILDLVVFLMIAELAAVSIEDTEMPLYKVILPIVALLIIQLALALLSLRNKKIRELLDGKPTIIIHQGKIDEKAMKKERYNYDDLLQQLREKEVFSLDEVAFAILEPSGDLSVMKKNNKPGNYEYELALPLILDGVILEDHLRKMNLTRPWLCEQLEYRGISHESEISFCSYHHGKFVISKKKG
ncbi:DUF421 domain-containing protein [Bacillus testis]|uniref:DUF421 domain-containing protein n=1 Tax=Bacillus testis TaxID=1622072 RepID=UPI00067EF52D|nr:DUF421 domain-containing protein [Bacillus testis]